MVDDPNDRKIYKENFYFRVKAIDVVNLKALYTMMHEFFVEEEWCGDDKAFPEIFQRDRQSQKRGREILVHWRLKKEPFGIKFYKRVVDILIKIVGVRDVEVIQGGNKFKLQKGMVEVKVWGFLEYDALGLWRKNWFLKHFLDLYVTRMIKTDMEAHRDELNRDMEEFQAAIKEYMNLIQFSDKPYDIKDVSSVENPY